MQIGARGGGVSLEGIYIVASQPCGARYRDQIYLQFVA
jgi:hypothetical protein